MTWLGYKNGRNELVLTNLSDNQALINAMVARVQQLLSICSDSFSIATKKLQPQEKSEPESFFLNELEDVSFFISLFAKQMKSFFKLCHDQLPQLEFITHSLIELNQGAQMTYSSTKEGMRRASRRKYQTGLNDQMASGLIKSQEKNIVQFLKMTVKIFLAFSGNLKNSFKELQDLKIQKSFESLFPFMMLEKKVVKLEFQPEPFQYLRAKFQKRFLPQVYGVVQVLYDFEADGSNEISIEKGRFLWLREPMKNGWVLVMNPILGIEGFVPAEYLEIVGCATAALVKNFNGLPSGTLYAVNRWGPVVDCINFLGTQTQVPSSYLTIIYGDIEIC